MLTGEIRSQVDQIWNAFWTGGISNPLEVIEQITYLLFMRGLDEAHTREENKANRLGKSLRFPLALKPRSCPAPSTISNSVFAGINLRAPSISSIVPKGSRVPSTNNVGT